MNLAGIARLTPRQRDCLVLVCADRSSEEAAREMGVSDQTVKNHLTRVYATLDVASRAGACFCLGRAVERAAALAEIEARRGIDLLRAGDV